MSRVPGWLSRLGAGLTEIGERLDQRRAEVERADVGPVAADSPSKKTSDKTSEKTLEKVPPPPDYAPEVATRPDRPEPALAVPWGVRVAAEAGWRLLVLAGTLWVLMRVISAVQLVVLSFVAALLITALLEPAVTRLRRYGVPRGIATALTAILGFVVIGLIGWFVTWQVMENIDNLSDQIQDGIDELRNWLLNSPFHVTDKQINDIAENLREAIGANTDEITSAGLEGVTVIVEALTGILLAAFSTLFLLYDGKRIWEWTLSSCRRPPVPVSPGPARAHGGRSRRTSAARYWWP